MAAALVAETERSLTMFRLLADLKAEVAAWIALSRAGRERAAEVLGLDPDAPANLLPGVTVDEPKRKGAK